MKKLILLEGIPGSGKSTNARFISIQFERNAQKCILFHETTAEHPILNREEIIEPNEWMQVYLNNWKRFLADDSYGDTVVVLESVLFQNPILNLLNKDIERERIKRFIRELSFLLNKHEVSLIFFYQEDSLSAIHRMILSRGGQQFLEQKYNEFKDELYYVNRRNQGSQLHIDFLKEFSAIAKDVAKEIAIETIIIENSKQDWNRYEDEILQHYKLVRVMDPLVGKNEMINLAGVYRNDGMNFDIHIEYKEEHLFIFGNRKLKCRKKNTFYLDDMSVEVVFMNENGIFNKLLIREKDLFANRNDEGTEFIRI